MRQGRESRPAGESTATWLGGPKRGAGGSRPAVGFLAERRKVSCSFYFFFIFFSFSKPFSKMDFKSKRNEIKTTPHNKTNATT
jgi:hypothetical protein